MRWPALLLAVPAIAACTPASSPSTLDTTATRTITRTPSATFTFRPAPARSVAALPVGAPVPSGEREASCPYIAGRHDEGAGSIANLEGNRVGRITTLTGLHPVGCRFYFAYAPGRPVADIQPRTFDDPAAARDALIRTALTGTDIQPQRTLSDGSRAVLFRTRFYGPDGNADWACAFVAGRVLVVVRTERKDQSFSALQIADAIASRF
jgi:hypothetical protein